ncbi:uncharacterized protein [Littorina saxatilis]|uniref:Uncharacterized protein n=1 Tax=Littorina saxatilis TaxID=31220 RepID=A0AAN9BWB0_9CAEN
MSCVAMIIMVTLLATTAPVTSDSGDTGFERYECHRDLCVSRLQYCSDSERRCKLCQPAHCVNKDLTPKQCAPLCPELLNPPTTTTTATAKTTTSTILTTLQPFTSHKSSSRQQSTSDSTRNESTEKADLLPESNKQNGFFVSSGTLLLGAGILLAVLVVLVTVTVCTLFYIKDIRRRLPLSSKDTVKRGRTPETEEEETLLNSGLDRKTSSKTSGSASTVSSQPAKPASSPGPCQHQQQQQQNHLRGESLPPYTARPGSQLVSSNGGHYSGVAPSSAVETPSDSLQHQKRHDYHLMTVKGRDHFQDGCFQHPPVWEMSGNHVEFPYSEETCPKSV